LTLKDLAKTNDSITPHEAALRTTLEIGNSLFPGEMPHDVVVFAVQTHDVDHVTGKMSRAVKSRCAGSSKMIMAEITG